MAKGMRSLSLHRGDGTSGAAIESLSLEAPVTAAIAPSSLSAEAAAKQILARMMGAPETQSLAVSEDAVDRPEFKSLGAEKIPFTQNQIVKFRQQYNKIPVYGSLVSVELDPENAFVSINSTVGAPQNVDPVATVSPEQALTLVREWAGYGDRTLKRPVQLNVYFDAGTARWRLAYIVEDVLRLTPSSPDQESADTQSALPEVSDFVVDAHSGELIAELPRTQTMATTDADENATDSIGGMRTIAVLVDDVTGSRQMVDRARNIHTHDFQFRDAALLQQQLPGSIVGNPPNPWDAGAVSAHANAIAVAEFLQTVLERAGLDGVGGPMVSSVNCTFQNFTGSREWRNAARFLGQMVYGQRMVNGSLRSYAAALDIVAHELLHGLTEHTARLEYHNETGALNESYSDIFGAIVANLNNPDIGAWNWEMGEDLSGVPIRDMSDPTRFNQPAHMNNFRQLPDTRPGDWGGVHINSGIHNKAAFNLITSRSAAGARLFTAVDSARMFYITLAHHLSRTSEFVDSRRGVILAARSLFQTDARLDEKIAAIEAAFDQVGIVDPALPVG